MLEEQAEIEENDQRLMDRIKDAIEKQSYNDGDQAEKQKKSPDLRSMANSTNSDNGLKKMPAYIGTKIVCAIPMDECSFLSKYKNQDTSDRETQPGYLVEYEDGYKSWSPKTTFERSYRLITVAERKLI